jgi:hypothetical protein
MKSARSLGPRLSVASHLSFEFHCWGRSCVAAAAAATVSVIVCVTAMSSVLSSHEAQQAYELMHAGDTDSNIGYLLSTNQL